VPRVSEAERFRVTPISDGISRIELRFGFMERVVLEFKPLVTRAIAAE
jgi:K+ transporter